MAEAAPDDLDGSEAAAYELIVEAGSVYQSELWKALDLSSREGTRIARALADAGLIDREEAVHEGRVTYRLTPSGADEAEPAAPEPAATIGAEAGTTGGADGLEHRERRALALITESGGLYQSELWKALDVSSRTGSRIATSLAEADLIEREETIHEGRATYLLRSAGHTLDFSLLMADGMMSPLVGIDDLDPVESDAFTQWLFQLMAEAADRR